MKRLIVLALLCCLLLCACGQGTTPTEPALQTQPATTAETQPTTEPTAESIPATQPVTEATTEPTQAEEEKVTVYLLTKVTYFDSGCVEYKYDENHNIDAYTVFTLENTAMYEVFFENKDANGMAWVIRSQWPDGAGDETRDLVYSADGKLQQEQIAGSNYTGFQYAYDQAGNRTEKREYYDGILESAVYYEYDGGQLTAVYCEDYTGNRIYECQIENGLVTQKIFLDSSESYSYSYQYDENNNLVELTFCYEGETMPGDQYFYKAVEVDAQRANYLMEQQKYLVSIT